MSRRRQDKDYKETHRGAALEICSVLCMSCEMDTGFFRRRVARAPAGAPDDYGWMISEDLKAAGHCGPSDMEVMHPSAL
ncbi:hypothetical protein CEXT_314141 [Caerostris extrusa]|uniref:Uncharacterized protein n=1 Tax=Caerostris extrusa TaxID=172846 RepID=A0AAV4P3D6_CAEEX|nr:hypothetical protein CEXT_314141 [Caerostris extrusa]